MPIGKGEINHLAEPAILKLPYKTKDKLAQKTTLSFTFSDYDYSKNRVEYKSDYLRMTI